MSTLALDLGGTRIKAGIVSDGAVLDTFVLEDLGKPRLDRQLARLKAAFMTRPDELRRDVDGLAAALPCIVASDHQTVTRTFGKYDDAIDYSLDDWARRQLEIPAIVENDARAAAVGEWSHGWQRRNSARAHPALRRATRRIASRAAVASSGTRRRRRVGRSRSPSPNPQGRLAILNEQP